MIFFRSRRNSRKVPVEPLFLKRIEEDFFAHCPKSLIAAVLTSEFYSHFSKPPVKRK